MPDPVVSRNYGVARRAIVGANHQLDQQYLQRPYYQTFAVLLAGEHVGNVVLDRIDRYLSLARLCSL